MTKCDCRKEQVKIYVHHKGQFLDLNGRMGIKLREYSSIIKALSLQISSLLSCLEVFKKFVLVGLKGWDGVG